MSDLKPYTKDVIEKIHKNPGVVIHRLIKLNKTVPPVTAEAVDYWGEKDKEVLVLLEGDSCTILKKGYDTQANRLIFNPMPYDRINMIKSEMAIRKERLRKEKDILQAITPWIVAGITALALVAVTYFVIQGLLEINDENVAALASISKEISHAAETMALIHGVPLEGAPEIKQEEPPPIE